MGSIWSSTNTRGSVSTLNSSVPAVGNEALLTTPEKEKEIEESEEANEPKTKTGFPLANGMSLSYWLQGVRNNPLLDHRTTQDLPSNADVVIIGSGLTGTVVAFELLNGPNPPKSVVVLEAREFCSGATGRNAGHCKPDQWRGFTEYEKAFGAEQALKILANEQETWKRVVSYVQENNVDCDLWVGKTFDVAMNDEVAAAAAETLRRFKTAGGPTDHIEHITDREEAVKRSCIQSAVSVLSWDASTLYPWKLAAHIMNRCLPLGLNLQTWTPVSSVESSVDAKWAVKTKRGTINATSVVLATNAYSAALLPEFEGLILPTPHMCNKVIPPHSWSGSRALQNSYGVLCSHDAMYSINPRSTADGIVLFGGSNPNQKALIDYVKARPERSIDDGLINFAPVTQAVKDLASTEFEGWGTETSPGQGYDYSWSGIIGNSADGVPLVGPVPDKPGLWMCAGHNGHGMARIMTAAPGLVKLMRGESWSETGLPECYMLSPERLDRLKAARNN